MNAVRITPLFAVALAFACSTGSAEDESTTAASFGSGMHSDTVAGTAEANEDDSSDPCSGMTPCEDASDDIPITGGVASTIVPEMTVDLAPWAAVGVGGMMLVGTEGSENLEGAELSDTLDARGGNDELLGLFGNDWLLGGGGNDSLDGASGDDRIEGGPGIDICEGFDGFDLIYGGAGDDKLYGGNEADVLYGEDQVDELYGEIGDDRLFGGADGDVLDGSVGNDQLWGEAGDDSLFGGEGNDVLVGGEGSDMLSGGGGDDIYISRAGDGEMFIDGDDNGSDVLWIGGVAPGDLMPLRAGNDYVLVTPSGNIHIVDFYNGLNQIEVIQTELP